MTINCGADSEFIRATTSKKDVEIFDADQLVPEKDISNSSGNQSLRQSEGQTQNSFAQRLNEIQLAQGAAGEIDAPSDFDQSTKRLEQEDFGSDGEVNDRLDASVPVKVKLIGPDTQPKELQANVDYFNQWMSSME